MSYNPLFTVLKVFFGVLIALLVFMLVLLLPDLVNGNADKSNVIGTLQLMGGLALVFFILTIVSYAIYAAMQGGTYCVVFSMDEKGITHKQLPKQYKKAQVVGLLNVLAGLVSKSPSLTGLGIITSTHDSITSTFDAVRSIKGFRQFQTIKINEPFAKNQVYVEPDDYDFVFDYIRDHCPNATVKG